MKDLENTLENLSLAAEHAVINDTKPDGVYSSIFTDRHDYKKEYVSTNSMETSAKWIIDSMREETFDFCRDDAKFKTINKKLNEYKQIKN